jgi:aspartate-semialdehyde dehydrogenase
MPPIRGATIAIFGATGNVGRNIVALLIERKIATPEEITLFASKASAGKTLNFLGHDFTVHDMHAADFSKAQICLFATDSDVSKQYIPNAIATGALVVDSSSLYRLDPKTPLIVAPVNKDLVNVNKSRWYAMANCVSSPISIVLAPIYHHYPINRVSVTTYQSTSGAGKGAMDELYSETKSKCENTAYERKYFPRPIAFNVIPQIDKFLDDGSTYEEFKIIHEIKKIISSDLAITATAVRVPVMIGHSVALSIDFKRDFSLDDVYTLLEQSPSIKLSTDHYTTPVEVVGSDDVYVGRIRRDHSVAHGLHLWLCSDNLRRGAATDVVEVADELVKQLRIAWR